MQLTNLKKVKKHVALIKKKPWPICIEEDNCADEEDLVTYQGKSQDLSHASIKLLFQ